MWYIKAEGSALYSQATATSRYLLIPKVINCSRELQQQQQLQLETPCHCSCHPSPSLGVAWLFAALSQKLNTSRDCVICSCCYVIPVRLLSTLYTRHIFLYTLYIYSIYTLTMQAEARKEASLACLGQGASLHLATSRTVGHDSCGGQEQAQEQEVKWLEGGAV